MANKYTQAEREELQRKAIDLFSIGTPVETVADELGISVATASKYRGMVQAIAFEGDYKDYVRQRIEAHARKGFDTLDAQVLTLGDRGYIEAHGGEIFATAQAYRLVGEQIARFLAVIYG